MIRKKRNGRGEPEKCSGPVSSLFYVWILWLIWSEFPSNENVEIVLFALFQQFLKDKEVMFFFKEEKIKNKNLYKTNI